MTRKQQYAVGALVIAAIGIPTLRSVAQHAGSELNLTPLEVTILLAAGSFFVTQFAKS